MSTSLRSDSNVRDTAQRRIQSNSKGLGYWAAIDYAQKHSPELLPFQRPNGKPAKDSLPKPVKAKPPRRKKADADLVKEVMLLGE